MTWHTLTVISWFSYYSNVCWHANPTNGPPPQNNKSSANVGAIIGGVVGGKHSFLLSSPSVFVYPNYEANTPPLTCVGGLALLGLIVFFLLRRRRNSSDDFDGNFDPACLQHHGGGGGTLPQVNPNDDQLLNEDDWMGGRLAGSTVGGRIVTPFAYTPQQQEMANAYPAAASRLLGGSLAGYGAYGQQQQYATEDLRALSPTRSSFHPGPSTVSENS